MEEVESLKLEDFKALPIGTDVHGVVDRQTR